MFALATILPVEIREVFAGFFRNVVPAQPSPTEITFNAAADPVEPPAGASATTDVLAPPKFVIA